MASMAQWPDNDPIIMSSAAKYSLHNDPRKRCEFFDASLREIKILLYQVIFVACNHLRSYITSLLLVVTNNHHHRIFGTNFVPAKWREAWETMIITTAILIQPNEASRWIWGVVRNVV